MSKRTDNEGLRLAQSHFNRMVFAGTTPTATEIAALSTLMAALGSIGLAKFTAIYPFIGGTAATHALDLMGAFDMTWNGGITHDANGITGNGSTGYGDTGIVPSTDLLLDDAHLSYYSRSDTAPGNQASDLGASGSAVQYFLLSTLRSDDDVFAAINSTGFQAVFDIGTGNRVGHWIMQRTGAAATELFRNGSSLGTNTEASTSRTSNPIFILVLNSNGSPQAGQYSANNHAFASVGASLSTGEVTAFHAAILAFQTTLGRNV